MSSSSAKKVRKAARAGGGAGPRVGSDRKLGFPIAVAAITVLGLALVIVSRADRDDDVAIPEFNADDYFHAAYGIWDCDQWVTTGLRDSGLATQDVRTFGDFIIHLPAEDATNGSLSAWASQVGMTITDERLVVVGQSFEVDRSVGDDCGGEPGQVFVEVTSVKDEEGNPLDEPETTVITENPGSHRPRDGDVIAIAFAPEGFDLEEPPSAVRLEDATAVPEGRMPPEIEGVEQPTQEELDAVVDGTATGIGPEPPLSSIIGSDPSTEEDSAGGGDTSDGSEPGGQAGTADEADPADTADSGGDADSAENADSDEEAATGDSSETADESGDSASSDTSG